MDTNVWPRYEAVSQVIARCDVLWRRASRTQRRYREDRPNFSDRSRLNPHGFIKQAIPSTGTYSLHTTIFAKFVKKTMEPRLKKG